MKDNLRLIVLDNFKDVGEKVNKHLQQIYNTKKSFIIPIDEVRFENGEGKIVIKDSIREKDVYILSDMGNYSCTYKMYDFINHKSPDDHFQDLKRVIYAIKGEAENIHVVTPLLYHSRQNKRQSRESLDCAVGLQDLVNLNVKNIVAFDVHDKGMQNAIPLNSLENFYPTSTILQEFIKNEKIDLDNVLIISPDTGAVDRAKTYADIFRCNVGMFYKSRDLTKVINGKNPIKEHKYIGENVKGKTVIVIDDIISSGETMLDVCASLKNLEASKVYLVSTFALFTKGIDKFEKAYKEKLFDKIYSTNLTYINNETNSKEWFVKVDCSSQIAKIIEYLHKKLSLTDLLDDWKHTVTNI